MLDDAREISTSGPRLALPSRPYSRTMLSRCLRPVLAAPRARVAAPLSSSSKAAVAALASSQVGSIRKTALDAARATAVTGAKRFASSESQDGSIDVSFAANPPRSFRMLEHPTKFPHSRSPRCPAVHSWRSHRPRWQAPVVSKRVPGLRAAMRREVDAFRHARTAPRNESLEKSNDRTAAR